MESEKLYRKVCDSLVRREFGDGKEVVEVQGFQRRGIVWTQERGIVYLVNATTYIGASKGREPHVIDFA